MLHFFLNGPVVNLFYGCWEKFSFRALSQIFLKFDEKDDVFFLPERSLCQKALCVSGVSLKCTLLNLLFMCLCVLWPKVKKKGVSASSVTDCVKWAFNIA